MAQREERQALSAELADWMALADGLRPTAPFEPGCPLRTEAFIIEGERVSLRNDEGNVVCPWVGCPHHLATERGKKGTVTLTRDLEDVLEGPFTCSIDVTHACPEGMEYPDMAAMLGVTKQMVSYIGVVAIDKLRLLGVQGVFRGHR